MQVTTSKYLKLSVFGLNLSQSQGFFSKDNSHGNHIYDLDIILFNITQSVMGCNGYLGQLWMLNAN